jgi:hypothetical protein
MKLPSDIDFLDDVRLLIYRPRGVIDTDVVDKITYVLTEVERQDPEPFNRFFDTLAADEVDLNYKHIIQISTFRRLVYAGKPPVKSAILATDSAMTHYAQLHALITRDSPINVKVFHERRAAAQWLGVPVERLVALAGQKAPK